VVSRQAERALELFQVLFGTKIDFALKKLVPQTGFEPATPSLRMMCSTD
jgi:hypothetical protein